MNVGGHGDDGTECVLRPQAGYGVVQVSVGGGGGAGRGHYWVKAVLAM